MLKTLLFTTIVNHISTIIGFVAVIIISWGAILTFLNLIRLEISRFKGKKIHYKRAILRHRFGSYLLLGLEFMIAADIILTISHTSLEEIAILGSIVIIRSVISYFLDKEMAYTSQRHKPEN